MPEEHDDAFTADVNGAENIRLEITDESNSESSPDLGGHRSAGWLAQPGVSLQVVQRIPTAGTSGRLQIIISQLRSGILAVQGGEDVN